VLIVFIFIYTNVNGDRSADTSSIDSKCAGNRGLRADHRRVVMYNCTKKTTSMCVKKIG